MARYIGRVRWSDYEIHLDCSGRDVLVTAGLSAFGSTHRCGCIGGCDTCGGCEVEFDDWGDEIELDYTEPEELTEEEENEMYQQLWELKDTSDIDDWEWYDYD